MSDIPPAFIPTSASNADFRDRRRMMKGLGAGIVFLGCLALLMVLVQIFAQLTVARMAGREPNLRMIFPSLLIFGVMGVALIWLGIGSWRIRRWARTLLLEWCFQAGWGALFICCWPQP